MHASRAHPRDPQPELFQPAAHDSPGIVQRGGQRERQQREHSRHHADRRQQPRVDVDIQALVGNPRHGNSSLQRKQLAVEKRVQRFDLGPAHRALQRDVVAGPVAEHHLGDDSFERVGARAGEPYLLGHVPANRVAALCNRIARVLAQRPVAAVGHADLLEQQVRDLLVTGRRPHEPWRQAERLAHDRSRALQRQAAEQHVAGQPVERELDAVLAHRRHERLVEVFGDAVQPEDRRMQGAEEIPLDRHEPVLHPQRVGKAPGERGLGCARKAVRIGPQGAVPGAADQPAVHAGAQLRAERGVGTLQSP